jgi:hypothetical protein
VAAFLFRAGDPVASPQFHRHKNAA